MIETAPLAFLRDPRHHPILLLPGQNKTDWTPPSKLECAVSQNTTSTAFRIGHFLRFANGNYWISCDSTVFHNDLESMTPTSPLATTALGPSVIKTILLTFCYHLAKL
eukprot:1327478-Amphidinium_carterae.1